MSNEKTSAFSRTAVLHLLKNNGIYIGFFLIFLLFSFSSPYFFDVNNIKNIVVQSSIIAVIAIGLTLVILTGGIELSVGSVVALTSMISAVLISQFCLPVWVSVLLGILVGGLCGLINGIIISYGKVPAFIATLGMMSFARGLALFSTGGKPIAQLPLTYERSPAARSWASRCSSSTVSSPTHWPGCTSNVPGADATSMPSAGTGTQRAYRGST